MPHPHLYRSKSDQSKCSHSQSHHGKQTQVNSYRNSTERAPTFSVGFLEPPVKESIFPSRRTKASLRQSLSEDVTLPAKSTRPSDSPSRRDLSSHLSLSGTSRSSFERSSPSNTTSFSVAQQAAFRSKQGSVSFDNHQIHFMKPSTATFLAASTRSSATARPRLKLSLVRDRTSISTSSPSKTIDPSPRRIRDDFVHDKVKRYTQHSVNEMDSDYAITSLSSRTPAPTVTTTTKRSAYLHQIRPKTFDDTLVINQRPRADGEGDQRYPHPSFQQGQRSFEQCHRGNEGESHSIESLVRNKEERIDRVSSTLAPSLVSLQTKKKKKNVPLPFPSIIVTGYDSSS